MGILNKLKKVAKGAVDAGDDAASNVASTAADVAKRVVAAPSDVQDYGSRLKTNVQAELADPNSEGSKFANAPGGQYYLPKIGQKALGFVLPTPKETVNSNKQFIQNPGLQTGLRAGLADVSIASAPALVVGAAAAPKALAAGASQIAERGIGKTLMSESGARVLGGIASKAAKPTIDTEAKVASAKLVTGAAMRTERVVAKIGGERVAAVGMADEAADLTKAASYQGLPDSVLKDMNSPAAKVERVRRLAERPGAPGGLTKAPTAPSTIEQLGIEPTKAPRSRIAGAVSTANRPGQTAAAGGLKAASTEPPLAAEVAQHTMGSVFQKMQDADLKTMADQGVHGAQAEVASRAAAKAAPKSALGSVAKPVTAAQAEVLNATKPAASEAVSTAPKGGLGPPTKAAAQEAVTNTAANTPAPKAKPAGSNPNYSTKNGKVTTKALPPEVGVHPGTGAPVELTPRGSIAPKAAAPAAPRAPGGSVKGAPRGAAVKRPVTAGLEDALKAAGATEPTTAASVASKSIKTKGIASKTAPEPTAPKMTPPQPGNTGGAARAAKPAEEAAAANLKSAQGTAAAESPAAATAKRGVVSTVLAAAKRGKDLAIKGATVGAIGYGGLQVVNNFRGSGQPTAADMQNTTPVGQPQPPVSTAATVDDAIANLTDPAQRASMTALRAVQKKGEAEGYDALAALRSGLSEAQASPDMPTEQELTHPQVSARYAAQYKQLTGSSASYAGGGAGKSKEEAQGILLEQVGKKRDQLLQASVGRAVAAAKQRAKNEALRKKNAGG
jgi:hypothetical protein